MTVELYLGAGQSNALESAKIEDMSVGLRQLSAIDASVTQIMRLGDANANPVWQDYGPESLQPRFAVGNPTHPRQYIGHSLSMGRGLSSYRGAGNIVMTRIAVSGTSIGNWLPDADPLEGEATNLYTQLSENLTTWLDDTDAEFSGFYWTQGNANAGNVPGSSDYAEKLGILFTAIRTDFNKPSLRIVYDQLPSLCTQPFTAEVRAQQVLYAATDPNARMISTDDTYLLRDGEHYTSDSFMRLGWRFANAFIDRWQTPALLGEF